MLQSLKSDGDSGACVLRIFSLTEPKAQVSFSDLICPLFVVVVIVVGIGIVVVVINFSHYHFLLQKHWVNLNQTGHKAFFGEGDSSLFK